jgi:hypothetical protein
MKEHSVVITEKDGKYEIQNNGISEFALLGILESIVFAMKSVNRQISPDGEPVKAAAPPLTAPNATEKPAEESPAADTAPAATASNSPELRTRIGNAVKAIKSLGGNVPDFEIATATDEELQEELAVLTEQYKRLKNSAASKK